MSCSSKPSLSIDTRSQSSIRVMPPSSSFSSSPSAFTAKTEIKLSSCDSPARMCPLFDAIYDLIFSSISAGTMTGVVKYIFNEPALLKISTRNSSIRGFSAELDAACFLIKLRYLSTNFITSDTPVVSRATRGIGVKSDSTGISSTGVVINSAYSSSRGGT